MVSTRTFLVGFAFFILVVECTSYQVKGCREDWDSCQVNGDCCGASICIMNQCRTFSLQFRCRNAGEYCKRHKDCCLGYCKQVTMMAPKTCEIPSEDFGF
ncbi:uncharacterized protein SJCHGC09800 [Lingula anatina]|uniref:Uncharacterized protein SJCHGC09800 n=1 Tax=Lingula anatina TaxID=7574 RepID=A0A1S3IHF6_LINAN|nr:uncharacterized protein SJCHGC09800 [Lingula anatina]XP_013397307.1 uncharacterized protein SJCHGC09800 [Lingula anatina]|eukprot:XP_013397306.1 uncharacterized protein SJCHGC09800 [Lingula anatina]